MSNQLSVSSRALAFLLPAILGLSCVERDWNFCSPQDKCRIGYTCTADWQCVREVDGSADGPLAVDSNGTADQAIGMDSPAAPDSAAIGRDAAAPDSVFSPPDSAVSTSPDGPAPDTTSASRDTADVPLPGTGGVGGVGAGGTNGAGGVPGSGGSGGVTGGAPGSGGVPGSGGSSGVTGGAPGSGGATGSGGRATGGAVGSGGTVATGGLAGTGGSSGTGGATCQPKSRDCTSSLDNNCNGTPDNQETTYCACAVGQSRACQEHPGYDGVGICKAGSQSCAASSDKTTSSWGVCSGAVGPGTEVCDAAGLDENCNGQSNEGCDCVNGTPVSCDCGPATTCTNGQKGTCSVSKVTLYLDSDGDGYGNPARPALVCPGTSGYVSNADDCDDSSSAFKPGISVCAADSVTRKWCVSGAGGITKTEACDQGCFNGTCRTDGTIGLPGYVSCTDTHSPRCLASEGCNPSDGTCGGTPGLGIYCDGPNDCPSGQKCWYHAARETNESNCYADQPANYYEEVCDPLASTCNCGLAGTLYTCQ